MQWDDPTRLLQVGLSADKGGVTIGPVERGELDQEQHDAIRDVFLVPTACVLVRADLFTVPSDYNTVPFGAPGGGRGGRNQGVVPPPATRPPQ